MSITAATTAPEVEAASQPAARQSTGKTLGQLWGILFLGLLFGMGGYRLLGKVFLPARDGSPPLIESALTMGDYLIYAAALVFGFGKAEMLFRRKFVPRTLARARSALGETGWAGDYVLAPFCMLS